MTYGLWAFELSQELGGNWWYVGLDGAVRPRGAPLCASTWTRASAGEPEDLAFGDRMLEGLAVCLARHRSAIAVYS